MQNSLRHLSACGRGGLDYRGSKTRVLKRKLNKTTNVPWAFYLYMDTEYILTSSVSSSQSWISWIPISMVYIRTICMKKLRWLSFQYEIDTMRTRMSIWMNVYLAMCMKTGGMLTEWYLKNCWCPRKFFRDLLQWFVEIFKNTAHQLQKLKKYWTHLFFYEAPRNMTFPCLSLKKVTVWGLVSDYHQIRRTVKEASE